MYDVRIKCTSTSSSVPKFAVLHWGGGNQVRDSESVGVASAHFGFEIPYDYNEIVAIMCSKSSLSSPTSCIGLDVKPTKFLKVMDKSVLPSMIEVPDQVPRATV